MKPLRRDEAAVVVEVLEVGLRDWLAESPPVSDQQALRAAIYKLTEPGYVITDRALWAIAT